MQEPVISKELQDKVNSLRALTTCHNLLGEAMLPVRAHEAIKTSQAFLQNLHAQVLEDCLQHPDAPNHPELKQILEQREKAAKFAEELTAKSQEAEMLKTNKHPDWQKTADSVSRAMLLKFNIDQSGVVVLTKEMSDWRNNEMIRLGYEPIKEQE